MTEERDVLKGDPDSESATNEPDAVTEPTTDGDGDDRGITVPQGEDRGVTIPQGDVEDGADES